MKTNSAPQPICRNSYDQFNIRFSRTYCNLYRNFAAIVFSSILVAGCAGHKLPKNIDTRFTTRITSSGLKQFEVRLVPQAIEDKPLRTKDLSAIAGRDSAITNERVAQRVTYLLEHETLQLMQAKKFCREGFWLIDSNPYGNTPTLRGECNEIANDIDRQRFPDTITYW
jgi:hypothetical protein